MSVSSFSLKSLNFPEFLTSPPLGKRIMAPCNLVLDPVGFNVPEEKPGMQRVSLARHLENSTSLGL